MNRWRLTFVPLVLALAACGVVRTATPPPSPTLSAQNAPATISPATVPTPATSEGPVMLQSASMSLIAADPVGSAAALQEMVLQAGGFVASSSSWSSPDGSSYASLSARVPPDRLAALSRSAVEGAIQVQSNSMYAQDVSADFQRLLQRAADLERAEADLGRFFADGRSPVDVTSLMLLNELLRQERNNIESQIQSYQGRMVLASLDISWSMNAATPTPLR